MGSFTQEAILNYYDADALDAVLERWAEQTPREVLTAVTQRVEVLNNLLATPMPANGSTLLPPRSHGSEGA